MKYVIYCRRSSDESSDKQTQSIPDQINRCIEYAKRNNLAIMQKSSDFSDFETQEEIDKENNDSDIINKKIFQETRDLFIVKESETAKIPYKRKKWRKLMKMIKDGKIEGLLSYSPDRQARNILEGGELINYVDECLVDLKYTNFHFENTASGKMMLGVWFVFAKQYSDAISENVNRGNFETINRGKNLGHSKYAYIRTEDGYYKPDEEKFDLMKKAFEMKIYEQKSNIQIANWLNSMGRKKKRGESYIEASAGGLSKVWKDPFYCGELIIGDYHSNQFETNPYFKPLITKEEYEILASRIEKESKDILTRKKIKDEYEEMSCIPRNMLVSLDGYSLTPNLPNKKSRHLPKLYELQKQNPEATLKDVVLPKHMRYSIKQKKSQYDGLEITGEEIEKAVYEKLQTFKITSEAYKEYVNYMKTKANDVYEKTCEEKNKITLRINNLRNEQKNYIDKHMGIFKDEEEQKIYDDKKQEYASKIQELEKTTSLLSKQERDAYVELEVFLDIMNRASDYYKKGSYVQKAKITEIFFSNIVLDDKKNLIITPKHIFEALFENINLNKQKNFLRKSFNGAGDATRTRNQLLGRQGL